MSNLPLPPSKSLRPSTGPRPALVRHGAALIVVAPMADSGLHRPLALPLAWLERFSLLMAQRGHRAHVARMAFDRVYARDRARLARQSGDEGLRAFARELSRKLRKAG